jgi:thiol-disulfide isomerase/thioredoxin
MEYDMIKKALLGVTVLAVALVSVASALYVWNATPTVPTISLEAANTSRPYVVKLHAQWCPICMLTKKVWSQIEGAYSGRAKLVVFDFTNKATTEMSRAQAKRLGLEKFFDENAGSTGTIAILDGRTKEETASIHGIRGFDEYRAAIDASLSAVTR